MKRIFFLVSMLSEGLCVGEPFNLKVYERSLKQYIPWSLTGSAQNLRSDAKNQLQMILRAFVLLRPDALWTEENKPTLEMIVDGFKNLKLYLAEEGNEDKRQWVLDSIAYLANTYIPEIQQLLESAKTEGLSAEQMALLQQKEELFTTFSQSLVAGQEDLMINPDRSV